MERIQHRLDAKCGSGDEEGETSQTLTFTYSSQISMKNDLIPSSFRDSCSKMNFISATPMSDGDATTKCNMLTARCDERRHCPLVELVDGLQVPLSTVTLGDQLHGDLRTSDSPFS